MYGATPARTQAHAGHPRQAAVPRRLEPRPRLADRVPGGRLGRRRVHRQHPRHRAGALDAERDACSGARDIRHGKMAASPAVVGDDLVVHGMDGVVRVLDRRTGRLRLAFRVGSPIESSPIVRDRIDYFGAWNGNVYALDLRTRKLRWVYRAGCEDHLERRDRRPDALHRRLRRPAARARARERAAALVGRRQRADLRDARGLGRPRVRALLGRRLADRLLDARALPLAQSTRAATSTPHRPSGAVTSSSAPTTDGSTAPRRAPGTSAGRCRPAGRSRAPRRSSTGSPTPAASRTASSASTPTPAACCSAFRTASTCPSPGTAAGCSCTAIRVCTRSSHRKRARNQSFESSSIVIEPYLQGNLLDRVGVPWYEP